MAETPKETKDKLQRKVMGVRVGYVLVAVLCYFGTMLIIANFGTVIPTEEMVKVTGSSDPIIVINQDMAWSALQWLIAAIGGAVFSDMARPSGAKAASFGISSNGNGEK